MSTHREVLKEFRACHAEGVGAHGDFFVRAAEEFDYYAGKQWLDDATRRLNRSERPALTFNQTNPIINTVGGSEITARYETRYRPQTLDDTDWSSMLTETARSVRARCDAASEESAAFRDMAICGLGWTEHSFDPFDGKNGKIKVDRVPVFEMLWESTARRANLEDADWVMRGKWITEATFEALWGKEMLEKVKSSGEAMPAPGDGSSGKPHDQTRAELYLSNNSIYYDAKRRRVPVWDFQQRKVQKRWLVEVYSPEGEVVEELTLNPDEYRRFEESMFDAPPGSWIGVPQERYVYIRSMIGGGQVLESAESEIQNFTYKAMTGMMHQKADGTVEFFGLMKQMRDPQSWVNKMLSNLISIVSTNPKGAVVAEKGVFANIEQARTEWGKPNPILEANPGMLQTKRIQIVHGKHPSSIERIMQIAADFLPQLAGVGPYTTGTVDDLRRTAGSAVSQVQRQGQVTMSVLFDALRRYRKETGAGGLMLQFIEKFIPDGTIIRLTQDAEAGQLAGQAISFEKRWLDVEYDIVVDESPVTPTQSVEFWNGLVQGGGLEILFQTGLLTPDILAEIMPGVPTTVRDKMKRNAQALMSQQVPPEEGAEQPQGQ